MLGHIVWFVLGFMFCLWLMLIFSAWLLAEPLGEEVHPETTEEK